MGFGCCICNETLYQKTKSSVIVGDTSKTERPVVASKCGHLYHNDCLKTFFIKQGSEVWTTRQCPKCDMSLTVATDIIRIFTHAATDANAEDLDDANIRIKKLQSDKEELVKRLETSFLQSRDTQKNYNKLEKELLKRKGTEAHLREEILNLRKENEELKNAVVRMSKTMTREPPNAGGFMVGPVMPPPQHPSQFYGPYPMGYGPRPNFAPYPHPYAMGHAGMVPNGFRPYGLPQGQGQMFHSTPPTRPPRLANNKTSSKSKYDNHGNGQKKSKSDTYGNTNQNVNIESSENEVSSDSESEVTRKNIVSVATKENGKTSKEDSSGADADKFLEFLRNGSTSPPTSVHNHTHNSREKKSKHEMNLNMDTPDDTYFDEFFKNNSTEQEAETDMMRFIEEEQAMLANRFANQSLDEGQGPRRIFGKYRCAKCGSKWGSARAESNQLQKCVKCKNEVFPYEQGPVLSKPELRALRKGY